MQWISLKDKLPDDNLIVLITDGISVGISSCETDYSQEPPQRYISEEGYYIGNSPLTEVPHWMPLPEPPAE